MVAVIIDGISTSGKSLMLQGIQNFVGEEYQNYSKLYLTEHLTERFFENQFPTLDDVHSHISGILRLVKELQFLQNRSPFSSNPKILTVTIERLFLTLISRKLMSINFFHEYEELLGNVELRNILLVIPDELIRGRIERSLDYRNKSWCEYIDRLGGLSGATEYFQRQQEAMLQANNSLDAYMQTEVLVIHDIHELTAKSLIKRTLYPNILL